jgi:hypothetical protein
MVTYIVITRIEAVLINALIGLLAAVICSSNGAGEGSPQCRHALRTKGCNANRSVTGFRMRITARAGGDAAGSFLPVVVPTRAAPAQAIATHDVVHIAALEMTTTKTSGCGAMGVGASRTETEVATVDESPSERQRYGLTETLSR